MVPWAHVCFAVFTQLTYVPNTQTDTQTMLRATTVAVGRIYALHAG